MLKTIARKILHAEIEELEERANDKDFEFRNIELRGENENLRIQNAELLRRNTQLESLIPECRNTAWSASGNEFPWSASGNEFHSAYSAPSIPQGTIEAVKYAMKKSHPDSGGNHEDFIKFRRVYEQLTGKG